MYAIPLLEIKYQQNGVSHNPDGNTLLNTDFFLEKQKTTQDETMITKEQYAEIKTYVLSRLSSEPEFSLTPQKFCEMFQLKKPYYQELMKFFD